MMKILTIALFLSFSVSFLSAQTDGVSEIIILEKKLSHNFNLAIATNGSAAVLSPSYFQTWHLGKKRAIQLSYGVRHSHYFGKDRQHLSAPPEFYGDEEATDSVFVSDPKMGNIVLFIGASYLIKNRVELGFNIDAVGYTFGGDRDGIFTSSGVETPVTVNPGSISALLVGANDIGMVKVEIFAGYKFNRKWSARLGIMNLFTEYRTPTEIQVGNTRFRAESRMPHLSVTYTPDF